MGTTQLAGAARDHRSEGRVTSYATAKLAAALPWAFVAALLGFSAAAVILIVIVLGSCIPRKFPVGKKFKRSRKRKEA